MFALAVALLLQASSPPEPDANNAPIVRLDPDHMSNEMLSHYPIVDMADHRIVILGIYLDGDRALLDQVKAKLFSEGWSPGLVTPPGRPTGLSIPSQDRKFEDVDTLIKRLRAKEFGDVQATPLTERLSKAK